MTTNGKKRAPRNSIKMTFGQAVDKMYSLNGRDQAEQDALLERCEAQTKAKLRALQIKQSARRAMIYERLDFDTKKRVWDYVEKEPWDGGASDAGV